MQRAASLNKNLTPRCSATAAEIIRLMLICTVQSVEGTQH